MEMLEKIRMTLYFQFTDIFNTQLDSIGERPATLFREKIATLSSWWADNVDSFKMLVKQLVRNYQKVPDPPCTINLNTIRLISFLTAPLSSVGVLSSTPTEDALTGFAWSRINSELYKDKWQVNNRISGVVYKGYYRSRRRASAIRSGQRPDRHSHQSEWSNRVSDTGNRNTPNSNRQSHSNTQTVQHKKIYLSPLRNQRQSNEGGENSLCQLRNVVMTEERKNWLLSIFGIKYKKFQNDISEILRLVFTGDRGAPISQSAVRRHFKSIAERIGLPDLRFHDLRHSFAVASLQNGDDVKTVQENLGHHSASFTLNVYGHVTDKMRQDSAERMENYIKTLRG